MGAAEGILVGVDGLFYLLHHVIGDPGVRAVFFDPVGSGQGGNEEHVVLLHEVEAPVVHEEAVLDGVHAGPESVFDAFHALGMSEGFGPCLVGFFDGCAELLFGELRGARLNALGHNASGGHDLDPVGAGL